MTNPAQLINQNSGNTEYYTPTHVIEAARQVMGGIDFDPASSEIANQIVQADRFCTIADDGLMCDWTGRVWMNHPYGRDNKRWINKFIGEYINARMDQGMCITYAATSEAWFKPLHAYPQCYLTPRTNYLRPDGELTEGVTKGSVITYLGPNIYKFIDIFDQFGAVKLPAFKV